LSNKALRAEQWAHQHQDETRRFLARETNSSEFYVTSAYSENAHLRLRTDFAEEPVLALQDFSDFLLRWKFIPERVDVSTWLDQRPFEKALERLSANFEAKAA
jgi:ABC-type nitrate/sulfonate/bicarbonate transport system substrate-binding protein